MKLREITVTSTRTERRIDDVPNTVTVVTHEDIQQKGAGDIKDMFKDELGVSVRKQPKRYGAITNPAGRGGASSINIRGIEGNRVLMTLDGIRVPDAFSFGNMATSRGDFIDMDTLKTAEVLRGPASTQFGSDGLAGAVGFRTLDPSDLLRQGESFGGYVRGQYADVDNSYGASIGLATRGETTDAMIIANYRHGHETKNKGTDTSSTTSRTAPNPSEWSTKSALAKFNVQLNGQNKVGLAVDVFRRNDKDDVLSSRSATLSDVKGNGTMQRARVSLSHHFMDLNHPLVQRADTTVYWQDSETRQKSNEHNRTTNIARWRDSNHETTNFDLSTLLESNITDHKVTYGIDWNQSDTKGMREGDSIPANATSRVKERPFANTRYTLAGAFIQDEIRWGNTSIIPGVRYDYYNLKAQPTDYYPGGTLHNMSGSSVNPRLGIVIKASPLFNPFAQWARGFKAPTPDQVNTSFSNPAHGYTRVGNPNLKPETSNSFEAGLRGNNDVFSYSVSAFHNKYKDFISNEAVSGSMTPADPTVFQDINLSKVTIRGVEARAAIKLTSALTLKMGLAHAKGESEAKGKTTPLDTVDPLKATLGLDYNADNWGTSLDVTHAAAKERDAISTATYYATPSFTVVDLGAHWKPVRNMTISANVHNVFDTKYWNWSDVRSLSSSSTVIDAYTAPGRNAQVSLRYDF